ncbi:hypothetical protein RCL1_002851 [Eukaryota sp. TZLM3-RCL]
MYDWKNITTVPTATEFIDMVLRKTITKTPTVIHKSYPIPRIRQFYMRKVRFTAQTFCDRIALILEQFPHIEEVHPFYADLLNILYDKDHYKIALGDLNTTKHIIDNLAKDYVRFLKYGDSLYRCKQLKIAALGRMCTALKRKGDSLAYLERIRQHMSRLPTIDPNTRTLILTGYPNVGKSSFMNKVTKANVDVQPFAFTTKSLYTGHFDYEYLRFQVIDTPGILDHPLDQRNTIEMQAITALAHLRAAVLYLMDVSEQCGHSIEEQVALFQSIKPLFVNKPVVVVLNKVDITPFETLPTAQKELIESLSVPGVELIMASAVTEEGIAKVKDSACKKLIDMRADVKVASKKFERYSNRIFVAEPQPRDDLNRDVCIPDRVVKGLPKTERETYKEVQARSGGAGVYSYDYRDHLDLPVDDWKYDVVPEILNGKNIADFFDADIAEKLALLEEEEDARLESQDNSELIRLPPDEVHKPSMYPKETDLSKRRKRRAQNSNDDVKRANNDDNSDDEFDSDMSDSEQVPATPVMTSQQKKKEIKQKRRVHAGFFRQGKSGEADRHVYDLKPKHLNSGKRGIGKSDHR